MACVVSLVGIPKKTMEVLLFLLVNQSLGTVWHAGDVLSCLFIYLEILHLFVIELGGLSRFCSFWDLPPSVPCGCVGPVLAIPWLIGVLSGKVTSWQQEGGCICWGHKAVSMEFLMIASPDGMEIKLMHWAKPSWEVEPTEPWWTTWGCLIQPTSKWIFLFI